MMKKLVYLYLSIIVIFMMACSFGSSQNANEPVVVQPTQKPIVIEITPTISPFAPEEANAGIHHYWMSPYENGCEASEDTSSPLFRDKEHTFTADFASVSYGGREYFQVGEHHYQSINQSDKPLVLEYSEHGFILYVFQVGDDPNLNDPCLYFSFTLQE